MIDTWTVGPLQPYLPFIDSHLSHPLHHRTHARRRTSTQDQEWQDRLFPSTHTHAHLHQCKLHFELNVFPRLLNPRFTNATTKGSTEGQGRTQALSLRPRKGINLRNSGSDSAVLGKKTWQCNDMITEQRPRQPRPPGLQSRRQ